MREIPLRCTIRLWDAYLAEQDGFASLHLFVSAAFLLYWKQILLQQTDFQGLLMLLQKVDKISARLVFYDDFLQFLSTFVYNPCPRQAGQMMKLI